MTVHHYVPLPLARATRLLNPGPLVLVSTVGAAGPNLCAVAWAMPYDKDPPTFVLALAEGHLTFANLLATGELTIGLPTADLLPQALLCGSVSGREADKWAQSGLTPLPLPGCQAAGIAECAANLGCRLVAPELARDKGLVLATATVAYGPADLLRPDGTVDVARYPLVHHLGGRRFYAAGEIHEL